MPANIIDMLFLYNCCGAISWLYNQYIPIYIKVCSVIDYAEMSCVLHMNKYLYI